MSVNIYDKTTGSMTCVAGGQRIWIGSKAAHDAEALADKLPYNCLIAILETGLYFRNSLGVESPIITGSGDIQVISLPTASAENLGKILQYTGTTTAEYTHGYFYECVYDAPDYKWQPVKTQEENGLTTEQVNALLELLN